LERRQIRSPTTTDLSRRIVLILVPTIPPIPVPPLPTAAEPARQSELARILSLPKRCRTGPRIAEIMMESGRKLAPFVAWRAETALAFYWNKSMEPVYADGKLSPWGPVPERRAA